MKSNIILKVVILAILFTSCFNKVQLGLKPKISKSITSVSVINNQIKVTGSNLANITTLKIKNGGLDETFTVESATATEVIANAGHAVTIGVGQLFDLILNSAEGAAIFPVSFSNTNGSITAVMLSSMGASTGQFLKFNGTTWIPTSITSSQTYKGTWNANTNSPDLNLVTPLAGDYYIVTTAGTQGAVSYAVGDYIISNGTVWSKLTNSISFNGRTGAVVPTAGDYTWSQITKTGSKIQDIEDVDMTGVAAGKILKWSGTNWIMGTDNGGGTPTAGSVTNLEVAAGANIAQSKIQNLASDLAGKEPTITAQATTKYFRGDKTFVTLDTSVVPENTNLYFTNARTLAVPLSGFSANNAVITAADTVLSAFGKAQGQINNLGTGSANYLVKNSTDSITGVVNVGTIGLLQLNYVPVGLTDAPNKQYVDTQDATKQNIITKATVQDVSKIRIYGGNATNYVELSAATLTGNHSLIFPDSNGSTGQVLKTDGAGNLTWSADNAGGAAYSGGNNFVVVTNGSGALSDSTIPTSKLNFLSAVTSDIQAQLNAKQTTTLTNGNILVGSAGNVATSVALSGDATIINTGAITLKNTGTAGTYTSVTTDAQGRVTGGTNPVSSTSTSGNLSSTDWNTFNNKQNAISGTTINGIYYPANAGETLKVPLAPVSATDAVNKQYVDGLTGGSWSAGTGGNVGDVYRATGKVGVGTSTPSTLLEISGGAAGTADTVARFKGNSSWGSIDFFALSSSRSLIGDTNVNNAIGFDSLNNNLTFLTTTGIERMRIDSSGNVGVGTIAPTSKLHVAGSLTIDETGSGGSKIKLSGSYGGTTFMRASTSGKIFQIDENGVGASSNYIGVTPMSSGFGPRLYTAGIDASIPLRISGSGGGAIVLQDTSGNVGVGNNSPSYKLDVVGDVNVTGNFKINGTNITSGSGTVTNVTGTAPVMVATGTTTPVVSMAAATTSVDGYLTSANWNTFNNKEPAITAGSSAQYLKGDKTLGTFLTDVMSSLLTSISFATSTAITATDNLLVALGKLQAQITNKADLTNGAQSITASNINTTTLNGAAFLNGVWSTTASDIYRSSGNVGIGVNNPSVPLQVNGVTAIGAAPTATSGKQLVVYDSSAMRGDLTFLHSGTGGNATSRGLSIALAFTNGYVDLRENGSLIFNTNATEKMRLTAAGYLGLGTASPSVGFESWNVDTSGSNVVYTSPVGGNGFPIYDDSIQAGFWCKIYGHGSYVSHTSTTTAGSRDYWGTGPVAWYVNTSGATAATVTCKSGKSFQVYGGTSSFAGNVGIGTANPGTGTKLKVVGQIASASASVTTGAIDFSLGNAITTSYNCAGNLTFANLVDGGTYTLVVTDTATTQCNFSTSVTGDDAGTLTYRFKPANAARTASSHTIYTLMRIGTAVYVSWVSGF